MKLRLSVDLGASLVKALYQIEGRLGAITMDPQLMSLPLASLRSYKNSLSMADTLLPEDDAWLAFKKSSDECIVLGYLAKQFKAGAKLDQLKYEQATPKLMAIVGSISQKEGLEGEIDLLAAVLLPYGEYVNREQLKKEFERKAKSYYFRDKKFNVCTELFTCLPEGGGLIANLTRVNGDEWFAVRKVVVLMCGHRNTSLLIFDRGGLNSQSQTTDLGFIRLVESIIQRTTLNDTDVLTKRVYELGNDVTSRKDSLRVLIRAFQAEHINDEARHLAEVIAAARQEYWILLRNWLESTIPKELDELIIAGGASYYLKEELDQFLAWAEPSWGISSTSEQLLRKILGKKPDRESLLKRFKDAYALHSALFQNLSPAEKL